MSIPGDNNIGSPRRITPTFSPSFDGKQLTELYDGIRQLAKPGQERQQLALASSELADQRAAFIEYFKTPAMDRCFSSGRLFSLDPAGTPFIIIVPPCTKH